METINVNKVYEHTSYQINNETGQINSKSSLEIPKKKKKPPSKIIRDLRRLLLFKCKVKNTMKVSQACQTEPVEVMKGNTSKWKTWSKQLRSTMKHNKGKKTLPCQGKSTDEVDQTDITVDKKKPEDPTTSSQCCESSPQNYKKENETLTNMYENMEKAMKFARLEEPPTMTMALRHVVRKLHEKGDTIMLLKIDCVDRITLRTQNLPSSLGELLELIKYVYERRHELYEVECLTTVR